MSQQNGGQNDELMQLWQLGASAEPNPAEVARLAAKASMMRFDKRILRRNLLEYLAGALLLGAFGRGVVQGQEPLRNTVNFCCVAFVMIYLWRHHRRLKPLDPAANARSYQRAMLDRIDHQVRLLRSIHYWYLLPLSVPPVWQMLMAWQKSPTAAIIGISLVGALYAFLAWLNRVAAVGVLLKGREKIEALYPNPDDAG